MAKVNKKLTMQGRDTPVSAAGQGEQAGPQASSSCDRSSTVVGNLATVEFNASRRIPRVILDRVDVREYFNVQDFPHLNQCSKSKINSTIRGINFKIN